MEFDVDGVMAYEDYMTMNAVKGAMSRLDKLRSKAYNQPSELRKEAIANFEKQSKKIYGSFQKQI